MHENACWKIQFESKSNLKVKLNKSSLKTHNYYTIVFSNITFGYRQSGREGEGDSADPIHKYILTFQV